MYESNLKPKWPSCEGPQFGSGPAGETYFDVHYDKFGNEISEDKPMHSNSTPEHSGSYGMNHYDTDVNPGVSVSGEPQRSTVGVNASRADRGKES